MKKTCLVALFSIFLVQQVIGINLSKGLLLHYTFEEDFGEIVWDNSKNSNNGYIKGIGKRENGRFGKALLLDGKTTYVDIPQSQSLEINDFVTFVAWIKPFKNQTGTILMSGSHLNRILLMGTNWIEGSFGPGRVRYSVDAKDVKYVDKWTHVAATFDGKRTTLYINGKKINAKTNPNVGKMGRLFLNGAYTVGSERGNAHFYKGLIDEVRVYNRALEEQEIVKLVDQIPGAPTGEYSFEAKCEILAENCSALKENLKKEASLYSKQIDSIDKLIKKIFWAESHADPGMGNWALDIYPVALNEWEKINKEIVVLNSGLKKYNLDKIQILEKSINDFERNIEILSKKNIDTRALVVLIEKAEIYKNLHSLERASLIQKKEFLDKGLLLINDAKKLYEIYSKDLNSFQNVSRGDDGEFYPGVTFSLTPQTSILPLKLLEISSLGNSTIKTREIIDSNFKSLDSFFSTILKNDFKSMILTGDFSIYSSRFYENKSGFEDEFVEGSYHQQTGKWLIPAAPQDIPLKWISEQYNNVEAFAKRYGKNSSVLHWDVIGEAKLLASFYANSRIVQNSFREYLTKKYGNINKLNKVWSENHLDFQSIPVNQYPKNKWAKLEWVHFRNKIVCNYIAHMTQPFKTYSPNVPVSPVICMNIMYPGESNLDPYMLAKAGGIYREAALDIYAADRDTYPHQVLAAVVATGRSVSTEGRVWIGEMGYALHGKEPHSNCLRPNEVRSWYYTAFIHGAKGVFGYAWTSGSRSFSLMDSKGIPTESALKISELAVESRKFKNLWSCVPKRRVALYYPRLSHVLSPGSQISKRLEMMGLWALMSNCGFMIDPIDSNILLEKLDKYKILVLPPAAYLPNNVQDKIELFIKKGGVIIASDSVGKFNENNEPSKTSFRKIIEDKQDREKGSEFCKSVLPYGEGMVCFVSEDIGRTYRNDWSSTQSISEPKPPAFNQDKAIRIRKEMLALLQKKEIIPYSYSDTDEVETAIIENSKEKYLVLINHNSKQTKANIKLGIKLGTKEITEVFSLKRYEVNNNMLSIMLDPNEVLFIKLN